MMFTPQKKGFSGWTPSPVNPRSGVLTAFGKGKSVVDATPPPPPQASLGENGGHEGGGSEDAEVWRRFRDAGLLDESALQRKDREALVRRIAELEKELHEYQYNMGLLLIEKKEWASKYDEIRQGLAEAEEILKREQAAHLIAISEFEKREENMRKALGVEKQCVADLEKALREMRSEIAEVKFTSEKKLADAQSLEASLEEKYLEIEGKLHSADAKLAEASRKSSQADRKLEEVEARERKFEKEKLSFDTERKSRDKHLAVQVEHLRDWEINLQESQNRLAEGQRSLNDREDRANEKDKLIKKKQEELDEARNSIEDIKSSLKRKEEDISARIQALTAKEKDVETRVMNLETKEKELDARDEKLNARETVELQKLLDDHNASLQLKQQEFDLELQRKRSSFEEEMKDKLEAVEMKENENNQRELQFSKREEALENRMQKLKDKENDLEAKSEALKEWEASLTSAEKSLDEKKQQLDKDTQSLEKSKYELENLKATIEAEKQQVMKEKESLELTEEEREQHFLLTSRLKQEAEEYRMHNNSLLKETEDLREQRQKFEKEWEVLDEKRSALESEKKSINDEQKKFEKWRQGEEERLKNMELEVEAKCRRELEDLRLQKEAFENVMQHDRLETEELLKRGRADNERNLQLRKHDLEMEMENKLANREKEMQEMENELKRKIDFEENKIKYAIDLNESKIRKIQSEKEMFDREKEILLAERQKLEADQSEIKKDIDSLSLLSRNLKERREEFMEEKNRFLSLANQCKVCKNCGVTIIDELDLLGLQDAGNVEMPTLAFEEHFKSHTVETSPQGTSSQINSGGRMSWLQKCSRLFNLSPGKRADLPSERQADKPLSFVARLEREASVGEADYEPTPSYRVANDPSDARRAASPCDTKENEVSERLVKASNEPEPSFGVADNSINDLRIQSDDGTREMVGEQNISSLHQSEREVSSMPLDNGSQPEPLKQGQRQSNRRGRPKSVRRTRSVRAVVEDAKAILGEASEENNDGLLNEGSRDSLNIQEESQGDSVHTDMAATSVGQKRRRTHLSGTTNSELDAEESEARSDSISLGGRPKKRQTSDLVTEAPGRKRYNFRRSTIRNSEGTVAATQQMSDQARGHKAGSHQQLQDNVPMKSSGDGEGTSKPEDSPLEPSTCFVAESSKTSNMLQKSMFESVVEVHEFSQKFVQQFEAVAADAPAESNADMVERSDESREQLREDGVVGRGATSAEIEPSTPSDSGGGMEQDDEDEEDSDKHNVSIGKKLWTFFTT
ncbi:nuclear matrix constituent protein 1a isoform X1 [Typha angustifolia]|uniref:nuclear matrix constituent protein 1a isoform X1 n=1 Tax=Typha angustifolia TaxID=59011 RepID=UPI003C2D498C